MHGRQRNHSISRTFVLFNFTEYDVYNFCLHLLFTFLLQGNSSGSTAVCTFIRGKTIYAAWLGDSQAILVRNGQAVKIIEPHKPNRPVSWKKYFRNRGKIRSVTNYFSIEISVKLISTKQIFQCKIVVTGKIAIL